MLFALKHLEGLALLSHVLIEYRMTDRFIDYELQVFPTFAFNI